MTQENETQFNALAARELDTLLAELLQLHVYCNELGLKGLANLIEEIIEASVERFRKACEEGSWQPADKS